MDNVDDSKFLADYRREQSLKAALSAEKKVLAERVESCVESFALLTRIGLVSLEVRP